MINPLPHMTPAAALAGIGMHIVHLLILNPDVKALTIQRRSSLAAVAVLAIGAAALASMAHGGSEGFIARLVGLVFISAISFAGGDWRRVLPGIFLISVGMDLLTTGVATAIFFSGIDGADVMTAQVARVLGIWQFICFMSLLFKAKIAGRE